MLKPMGSYFAGNTDEDITIFMLRIKGLLLINAGIMVLLFLV